MRYDRQELQDEIASLYSSSEQAKRRIEREYVEVFDELIEPLVDVIVQQDVQPDVGDVKRVGYLTVGYANYSLDTLSVLTDGGQRLLWREGEMTFSERAYAVGAARERAEALRDAASELAVLDLIAERDRLKGEYEQLEALVRALDGELPAKYSMIAGGKPLFGQTFQTAPSPWATGTKPTLNDALKPVMTNDTHYYESNGAHFIVETNDATDWKVYNPAPADDDIPF